MQIHSLPQSYDLDKDAKSYDMDKDARWQTIKTVIKRLDL